MIMYYIGIKQKGFNSNNLLSEGSAQWVTYFNPNSKLKIQTANHYNSAGVKAFDNVQQATATMDAIKEYGIKGVFVARIANNNTEFIHE